LTVANVSYDDYLEAVVIGSVQYKNWRVGQTAFNVLAGMRPDIAEPVRGSTVDPFYADHLMHGHDKVAVFLAHVRDNW
jgi:hypothetical protein